MFGYLAKRCVCWAMQPSVTREPFNIPPHAYMLPGNEVCVCARGRIRKREVRERKMGSYGELLHIMSDYGVLRKSVSLQ